MVNVTDEPANGFMARVVFKGGKIEFCHFPQLGARKSDPADPTPQFDLNARLYYRPSRKEFLEMLTVTSGKAAEAIITTPYGANIALKKTADGFSLSMQSPVDKEQPAKPNRNCDLHFNNHYAAALKNFLNFAVEKQFGFDRQNDQLQQNDRQHQNDRQNNRLQQNDRQNNRPQQNDRQNNRPQQNDRVQQNDRPKDAINNEQPAEPKKKNRKGKSKVAKDEKREAKKPEVKIDDLNDW